MARWESSPRTLELSVGKMSPQAPVWNKRTTVLEEVNDIHVPMEPLHYPVVATVTDQLPPMAGASADGWMRRDESGACVIHIARHFDGGKLKLLLTKHNVSKTKMNTLHECMKLQGKFSTLSHDALSKVLAQLDSALDT